MDQIESQAQGIRPFYDESGRDYRTSGDAYNARDWAMHVCAKELGQLAKYIPDPMPHSQQHPLEHLASLIRIIADRRLSMDEAETFGTIVSKSTYLTGAQLFLLARWAEELAKEIQACRKA